MPSSPSPFTAALSALIVLQTVMLGALYAGVPPHPPAATPLFGIAPFLGAALAAALAAILLGGRDSRPGRLLGLLAALMALISFGPQKYLDAQFGLIWPAVIGGQLACLTVFWQLVRHQRAGSAGTSAEAGA